MHIHYQDQVPDEIVEAVGSPEIAKWFWNEYRNRQYAEFAAALKAQEEVSIANYKAQHRPHECLGENKFRIAKKLRNWIARKFGWAAATDLKFCEELVRDNKDKFCFVPTQEKRPMIVKSRDIGPPVITARPVTAPHIHSRVASETVPAEKPLQPESV
jgi:hypothetical protein